MLIPTNCKAVQSCKLINAEEYQCRMYYCTHLFAGAVDSGQIGLGV